MVFAEFAGIGLLIYIFSAVLLVSMFVWVQAFTPVCQRIGGNATAIDTPEETICINQILVSKDVDGNSIATQESVETLIIGHNPDVEANPALIFGDFVAAAQAVGTVIFQALTGGILFDIIKSIPFFNANIGIELMFRIITSFCGFCFVMYMLSGRA